MDNLSQFQFLVFPQKYSSELESLQCDLIAHLTFLETTWRRHMNDYLYFLNYDTD